MLSSLKKTDSASVSVNSVSSRSTIASRASAAVKNVFRSGKPEKIHSEKVVLKGNKEKSKETSIQTITTYLAMK